MTLLVKKDLILGKKITLYQPEKGYRVAIDPFFLAASVPLKPRDRVLDVGTGVGTIPLLLAHRNKEVEITGIDCDDELIQLAQRNAQENHFDHLQFLATDLKSAENIGEFNHVVTNPPYYDPQKHNSSTTKRHAQMETMPLEEWLKLCIKKLAPKGVLNMIHLTERLPDIMCALHPLMGSITLWPLYSKQDASAKRILIQARKDSAGPFILKPGIIIHQKNEKYTEIAEAILDGVIRTIE